MISDREGRMAFHLGNKPGVFAPFRNQYRISPVKISLASPVSVMLSSV